MRYGLGYRVKVHNKYFDFQPFIFGYCGILIDLTTKESRLLTTPKKALEMQEKDVKNLIRAMCF